MSKNFVFAARYRYLTQAQYRFSGSCPGGSALGWCVHALPVARIRSCWARGRIHAASTVSPITGGRVVVICPGCHGGVRGPDGRMQSGSRKSEDLSLCTTMNGNDGQGRTCRAVVLYDVDGHRNFYSATRIFFVCFVQLNHWCIFQNLLFEKATCFSLCSRTK
jgi:hypothetical protein